VGRGPVVYVNPEAARGAGEARQEDRTLEAAKIYTAAVGCGEAGHPGRQKSRRKMGYSRLTSRSLHPPWRAKRGWLPDATQEEEALKGFDVSSGARARLRSTRPAGRRPAGKGARVLGRTSGRHRLSTRRRGEAPGRFKARRVPHAGRRRAGACPSCSPKSAHRGKYVFDAGITVGVWASDVARRALEDGHHPAPAPGLPTKAT